MISHHYVLIKTSPLIQLLNCISHSLITHLEVLHLPWNLLEGHGTFWHTLGQFQGQGYVWNLLEPSGTSRNGIGRSFGEFLQDSVDENLRYIMTCLRPSQRKRSKQVQLMYWVLLQHLEAIQFNILLSVSLVSLSVQPPAGFALV